MEVFKQELGLKVYLQATDSITMANTLMTSSCKKIKKIEAMKACLNIVDVAILARTYLILERFTLPA